MGGEIIIHYFKAITIDLRLWSYITPRPSPKSDKARSELC